MLDDFCIWLEKVILWVDRTEAPPIPWIGQASGRLNNPPAPHIEFIYVLDGGWENVQIGSRNVSIGPGRLCLHNVHLGNYAEAPPGSNLVWCCFFDVGGVPAFNGLKDEPLFTSIAVSDVQILTSAFEHLMVCCNVAMGQPRPYLEREYAYTPARARRLSLSQRMMIKSACLQLLAVMLRESELSSNKLTHVSDSTRKAIAFISLNFRDPQLRLDDVAAHCGLSVDHFGRVFRTDLRMSPMQYTQALRIENGCFLLNHTRLTISEIAGETGFVDPYYFSRVFRKAIGVSPTNYRFEA